MYKTTIFNRAITVTDIHTMQYQG